MSLAETREMLRDKIAACRADAESYDRLAREQREKAAELEAQLAREEAAERAAASEPQSPAIPDTVVMRAWHDCGLPWWRDPNEKDQARAFAAAIAAHVVAQGTRVWTPASAPSPDDGWWCVRQRPTLWSARPAVLLYTDGQP